ncbi:MAG: P-loop protein [Pantoea eucrina]|nr:P-loop protein [Pantoea eucrina]
MKLLLDEINYEHGFDNGNDLFERQKLGIQLHNIIKNSDDHSLVLAIDDQWGNGKTTFLKMWETELSKDDKLQVIYFDAFKSDYQEDAFLALSSAIYTKIEEPEDKIKYMEAAKNVGKFLLKASVKIGLRAATLGIVKETDLEGIEDATSSVIEEPIEQLIENKLKSAEKEEELIQHFKNTITELAANRKVIFIIDELDRARPDFSLDLLEKMKHVFNTKNLYFVLAVNKEQYLHIINKRYGNIDSDTYLSKFIHFWFALPQPKDAYGASEKIPTFMRHLANKIRININYKEAYELITELLNNSKATLRDCERCHSLLALIVASNAPHEKHDLYSIAILAFLKTRSHSLFRDFCNDKATPTKIFESLNVDKLGESKARYIKSLIYSEMLTDEELLNFEETNFRIIRTPFNDPIKSLSNILPYVESIM